MADTHWIRMREAARRYGISNAGIYYWVTSGRIGARKRTPVRNSADWKLGVRVPYWEVNTRDLEREVGAPASPTEPSDAASETSLDEALEQGWISVGEAIQAYGLSRSGVLYRIDTGAIPAIRDPRSKNGRWLVRPPIQALPEPVHELNPHVPVPEAPEPSTGDLISAYRRIGAEVVSLRNDLTEIGKTGAGAAGRILDGIRSNDEDLARLNGEFHALRTDSNAQGVNILRRLANLADLQHDTNAKLERLEQKVDTLLGAVNAIRFTLQQEAESPPAPRGRSRLERWGLIRPQEDRS